AKVLQSDSKLGIVTRLFFTIRQIAKVPSKAFAPEPRTDAALLVLERSSSASFAEHVLKIMIMGKGKIKNTLQKGLTDYGYTKREAKVWIAQTRIAETTLNKPSKQSSAALLKRIQRELEKEA
ncbi:hypothetical protein HYZ97_02490, partial [Candidatus Pacearchaeota archaeon]|nr:hypothetical protein [Candidatus Pacearchaeota archaeon]